MQSTNLAAGHDDEMLLSGREAAVRLGIKLDTLYAYVSRGLLQSVAVPGRRERRYRATDIERFRRGRERERERDAALTPVIDSAICLIEDGRFYYRGRDAIRLADTAFLEDIAALLWGDAPLATPQVNPRPRPRGRVRVGTSLALGLIERCQIRLAQLAADDLAALDLTRPGVIRTGRLILSELVACIAAPQDSRGASSMPRRAPVHRRLAALWGLDAAGADLIRRALVLLADHELNASTFVARVVASTGATPYAVVSAALGALSGRRHGGASIRAEALLREIGPDGDAAAMMAARLTRGDSLPGIGQPVYPDGDPRAPALLGALAAVLPAAGGRARAAAAAAMRLTGQHPNVDFALGATTVALGLSAGAALDLFVIARTTGWIAHAIEQYESGILIRPRARYTGVPNIGSGPIER